VNADLIPLSGPYLVNLLSEKQPSCPECGEISSLHISSIEDPEFRCHGEEFHEFTVDTGDLLTEGEIFQCSLQNLKDQESIGELYGNLRKHPSFSSEIVADPVGPPRRRYFLIVSSENEYRRRELVQALEECSNFCVKPEQGKQTEIEVFGS
jgi:hypothetical protein